MQVTVYALSVQKVLHEKNRTLKIEGCGTQTSKPDVAECYALIKIHAGRAR